MVRGLTVVAALMFAVGVLWLGGEQHKSNCIDAKRVACSVLPWDDGQAPRQQRGSSIWDQGR